jgi:hypothetical protein
MCRINYITLCPDVSVLSKAVLVPFSQAAAVALPKRARVTLPLSHSVPELRPFDRVREFHCTKCV